MLLCVFTCANAHIDLFFDYILVTRWKIASKYFEDGSPSFFGHVTPGSEPMALRDITCT